MVWGPFSQHRAPAVQPKGSGKRDTACTEALPAWATLPARGAWPARLAYNFHPARCLGGSAPALTRGWHRGLRQAPTLLEAGALGSHLPGRLCTEVCKGRWSQQGWHHPGRYFPAPRRSLAPSSPASRPVSVPPRVCSPALPSTGRPAAPWDRPHSLALGLGGLWPPGHTGPAPRTGRGQAEPVPACVARLGEGVTACWSPEPPATWILAPPLLAPPHQAQKVGGGQVAHWIGAGGTLTDSRAHTLSISLWKTGQRRLSWDLTTVPGPPLVPTTGDASCPAAGPPLLRPGSRNPGTSPGARPQGPGEGGAGAGACGVLGGEGHALKRGSREPHAWGVGAPARALMASTKSCQVPRQSCHPAQELRFANEGSVRTPSSCDSSWLTRHGAQSEKHSPAGTGLQARVSARARHRNGLRLPVRGRVLRLLEGGWGWCGWTLSMPGGGWGTL